MKEAFEKYLVAQGYKIRTPSGHPSTAYRYIAGIENVCDWERLTWHGVFENIDKLVQQYDLGGEKEDLGNKSHRTIINALKRYQDFKNKL